LADTKILVPPGRKSGWNQYSHLAVLVAKRMAFFFAAIFGVLSISFLLIALAPGDPARVIAGSLATAEQVDSIRADLGLDQPIAVRYTSYMSGVFNGDLGESYYSKQPVIAEIADRLPSTVELVFLSVAVAIVVGVVLGTIGGYFRGRWPESASRGLASGLQAIPDFFFALLLILIFFFYLDIAPAPSGQLDILITPPEQVTGFVPIDALLAGDTEAFTNSLSHLVLPVLTLGLVYAGYFAKITRSALAESMQSQQVQFARASGLSEWRTLSYALVQTRSNILTYAGIIFASLFGGAAIVETIFSWNGLGQWALDGILRLDIPVIQGFVLVAGIITLLVYTLLDILVAYLDPRINYGE
jgi:ABC-type dipeptide/oligopeptide/nickel transport system permease component